MPDPDTPQPPLEEPLVPPDLDSSRSKLSYLYLRASGGARMTELRDVLGVPLLGLYPTVSELIEAGHVERTDDGLLRPRRSGSVRPP